MVYEDNPLRQQRVTDLVNNCVMIQNIMKETDQKWKDHDVRAYGYLEKVAKAAGYPSPREYVDAAIARLPEDERKRWQTTKERANKLGQDMSLAADVLGGVVGVTMTADLLVATARGRLILSTVLRFFGFRVLANAVGLGAAGAQNARLAAEVIQEAFELGQVEVEAARANGIVQEVGGFEEFAQMAARDGIVVEGGAEAGNAIVAEAAQGARQASQGLRYFQIGTRVLNVAALVATVGILIYEAVEGAKQKDLLQGYIVEYFAKRYEIKMGQMRLDRAFTNMTDTTKLLVQEDTLNELIKDGTITKEMKVTKMQKYIDDSKAGYLKSFTSLKDQEAIDALKSIDTNANSWTKEDPDMSRAKQWLKDNPPPKPADQPDTNVKN